MIQEGAEAARAQRKKAEAAPDLGEWKKQFGNKVKVDERSGEFTITLHEREDIKRAHQMQEASRRVEVERGDEVQSQWDGKREKVVRRDGRVVDFPSELMDAVKTKFRPAGRNGKGPSLRFGLSESYGRYEQGPDGLWFVWNDGWEPTRLFVRDRKVSDTQRDPDGNVWVKTDGEWLLESEVG